MTIPRDEFAWIRAWTAGCPTQSAAVAVPIGDDAAVTRNDYGQDTVSCIDTMTEGVHFDPTQMTMREIGWKCVAINLSDLAAMGAELIGVQVAVVVPPQVTAESVAELYRGIDDVLREYRGVLLGGDTVRGCHDFTVTVAALGSVPSGTAVTRAGARPGDRLLLTGPTGYSGSVWRAWARGVTVPERYRAAHTRPQPRLRDGQVLRELGATAMNDISDGLAADLYEIADTSQAGIVLDASAFDWLPDLAEGAACCRVSAEELALYGGEDYELAVTLPAALTVPKGARVIGRVTDGQGVYWESAEGAALLPRKGFNHFQEDL